ncbi:MAG TPA: MFS transporter [Pseudogracilibacillus sp.]|nr:MFS transporter [Pseudogracilibacillus sp.]
MVNKNSKGNRKNQLLWVLAGATFLIFFQAFMVAPLIPMFSDVFGVSVEMVGLIVPAYLITYGVATLVYGVLSDRFGQRPVIFGSLISFILLTGLTAMVDSVSTMITIRLLTGLGAAGVVPISLALIGHLFPYHERGRALGWLFGAMAGGMAFGSAFGALLEPLITWQGLFLGVAVLSLLVGFILFPYRFLMERKSPQEGSVDFHKLIGTYKALLGSKRGIQTYSYVLFNGIFHSGIFTWLGLYFAQHYGLNETGIGLSILGYGIPGLLLGPLIGRLADRFGRSKLIPAGIIISGLSAITFALDLPLIAINFVVAFLSLGYDMTQPLLAGIVTDLHPHRGVAMGLNVFMLFIGFGLGSLIFSGVLQWGISTAFVVFGIVALFASALAIPLFRAEARPAPKA